MGREREMSRCIRQAIGRRGKCSVGSSGLAKRAHACINNKLVGLCVSAGGGSGPGDIDQYFFLRTNMEMCIRRPKRLNEFRGLVSQREAEHDRRRRTVGIREINTPFCMVRDHTIPARNGAY